MKKGYALLLLLALLLTASGCSFYAQDYSYAAPYSDGGADEGSASGTEVKNFSQLKTALSSMVGAMDTEGELRFSSYSGSVSDDLAAACYEVKNQTPLGAYAVESLTYSLSRIVSYYTAEISISYSRSAEEVAAVETVNGVSALRSYIRQAVLAGREDLRFRIYSSTVNELYVKELVEQIGLEEPFLAAPELRAGVQAFPAEGVNRIYVLRLDYGLDGETLSARQKELHAAAEAACAGLEGESEGLLALDAARYLGGRCEAVDGAGDTAYDALVEGRADSRGMALGYMALCQSLGIDCRTVRGSLGILGTETHYWNIIALDGAYYHVDVSRLAEAGPEQTFLLSDEQAWGVYLWEPGEYPACDGPLSAADFLPPPEVEAVETDAPVGDGDTPTEEGGAPEPSEEQETESGEGEEDAPPTEEESAGEAESVESSEINS